MSTCDFSSSVTWDHSSIALLKVFAVRYPDRLASTVTRLAFPASPKVSVPQFRPVAVLAPALQYTLLFDMEDGQQRAPPGTVPLSDPTSPLKHSDSGNIVLQPQPSRDPNDPLNWSNTRKWVNFGIISFYTLMVFAVLDSSGPIWQDYVRDLGVTYSQLNNTNAATTVGLAMGSVLLIPVALKYGRRPLYIITSMVNAAMAVYSALVHNYGDLIASCLISGLSGSISEVIVQMTVADIFFVHQRGTANALYLLMVNIGAYLAPVASGYIAVSMGWRWVFGWNAIFLGVSMISIMFFYEETKYLFSGSSQALTAEREGSETAIRVHEGPKKDAPVTDADGNDIASSFETLDEHSGIDHSIPVHTYRQRLALTTTSHAPITLFLRHIYQPFIVLTTLPGYLYLALVYGTEFAWFSMISITKSSVFPYPPYNFTPAGVGLLSIPAMIGAALGSLYSALISDPLAVRLSRRNGGVYEPEFRLYAPILSAVCSPVGGLVYGLGVAAGAHWAVPCVGIGLQAFSSAGLSHGMLTYVIDAYPEVAGDGLVAVTFVRNMISTIVVFAADAWLEIGLRNCFISVACLAIFFNAWVVPMIVYGKRLRAWTAGRYRKLAERQYNARAI